MSEDYNSKFANWPEFLKNLLDTGATKSPIPPYYRNPIRITSPVKDLKSPLSKKWNPLFHNLVKRRLAQQTRQKIQRIKNITNGLTMPEIATVPIGSAKKMIAAILCFDLENFTATTSKVSNDVTLYILNTIIPEMMFIVGSWNGEIEKSTGDGLMSIFGTETRNNFLIARDAIEAAMAMRYIMLVDIQHKLSSEGIPVLNFRIGIDMDEVLISRIGIRNTNFLTVVGGAANRASKLQEMAESNGICIGENIFLNLNPSLHEFCKEGTHKDWNWQYTKTKNPYRFFSYEANWPEPMKWRNMKFT